MDPPVPLQFGSGTATTTKAAERIPAARRPVVRVELRVQLRGLEPLTPTLPAQIAILQTPVFKGILTSTSISPLQLLTVVGRLESLPAGESSRFPPAQMVQARCTNTTCVAVARRFAKESVRRRESLHRLPCDAGDQLKVFVNVQYDEPGELGGRGNDQVRDRRGPMPTLICQQKLHLNGTVLDPWCQIFDRHRGQRCFADRGTGLCTRAR